MKKIAVICMAIACVAGFNLKGFGSSTDLQSYQNYNHGYYPGCDNAPCNPCDQPCAQPCEPCAPVCAPCPAPCAPCVPCAPACGTQFGISMAAVGVGVAALAAAAVILITAGGGSSSVSHIAH